MNINLTLLGQMITFALLVWVTMKYIWPPIMEAMQERQKKIDGLAAAERGENEQKLAEERAAQLIHEAKQEASGIVAQAQKRSTEIVEQAQSTAREEAERIKTSAQAETEQELMRAREELRKQVGGLAVAGAERILQKEIDAKAHEKVVDDLVAQI